MGHRSELKTLLFSQLDAIENHKLTDELIESLCLACGDSMLLAALDLIDSKEGAPVSFLR